jgi:hypothetical protein
MKDRTVFHLKVTQIESVCHFELRGEGHIIAVNLNYPLPLTNNYEQWQKAYVNYYRWLRGQKVKSGKGIIPIDRHKELVNAEVQLLNEFHRWLLSPDLVNIRGEIAKAASKEPESSKHFCEVFLTCTPIELARLPWETWEIGKDLGIPEKIRFARIPATIVNQPVRTLRRKARILAILGDDTGLNFEADKQAVRSLNQIAQVEFVGWNGENTLDAQALKIAIFQAINDERGWDVLFFAGHSNEAALTGGELSIAPNVSLSIREIESALKQAKQRGLQFAIFNSCSGINIAESLINLGISQVIVMREPIHNQVAQEFLMQFLKSLAQYKDVHEALLDASQFLKQQEQRFSYPGAYLVPSLFRHPDAELFCIKAFGLWSIVKRWLPTPKEVRFLGALLFLSLLPPVQSLLLEPRILLQAVYRQVTLQIPSQVEAPLLLVRIDIKSLNADNIKHKRPIDYSYLAKLVQKLSQSNAKLIGIDYILDQVEKQEKSQNTQLLHLSIRDAIINKKTLFVFGSEKDEDSQKGSVSNKIASLNWSMQGDIYLLPWYVELPSNSKCSDTCPFSYLLAFVYSRQNQKLPAIPQPNLQNQSDFRFSIINQRNPQDKQVTFLQRLHVHPISNFVEWFYPIIDFSIPPQVAYNTVSACELLASCKGKGYVPIEQQVVIIAPGGYEKAGLSEEKKDNYTIPLAVAFWRSEKGWSDWLNQKSTFTGGEAHAYMVHHLLTRHLVIPIPDFLMVLLFSLLGKGMTLILLDNPSKKQKLLIKLGGATVVYIIISLQIYISATVLLPWFLPSVALWNYIRLALRKKSYG